MQIHIRQVVAAAATVIVVTGTAGCGGGSGSSSTSSGLTGAAAASGSKAGSGPKAKSGSTSSDGGSSDGSSDSSDGDSWSSKASLAGVDYCSLADPASVAAIGIHVPQGLAFDTDAHANVGCTWQEGHTSLTFAGLKGMAVQYEDGEKQEFSGFQGMAKYDDLSNLCQIQLQIGHDELKVTVADLGNQNPALRGKGCDVAAGFARQAAAKLKK